MIPKSPWRIITLASFILLFTIELFAQKTVLIKNVNVWDGNSDKLKNGYSVLIENDLIKQVGQNIAAPSGASVIDGKGKTLIPGLSDAHTHLTLTASMDEIRNKDNYMYVSIKAAKAAENFLMLGFTTVRDLGGPVFGVKRAIEEGLIPGPRIYPSGAFISQTSGHGDARNPNETHPYWSTGPQQPMDTQGWFFLADGPDEVTKAVRENLRNGATQLKVMAGGGISSVYDPIHSIQYSQTELEAAVSAAADWDTYVAVHIYGAEGIKRALRAGVKCIDHGHLVDEEAMKMIKEKNAWLVAQSYWSLSPAPDTTVALTDRVKKSMQVRAGALNEMELAKKYNVNLAYGTDAFGPLGGEERALKEFTSRVRWYKPVEVLKQATSGNAKLFTLSGKLNPYTKGKLGVIEPGAYADLLIYEGNPLEDIQVVVKYKENLKLIMKGGVVYKNLL